MKSGCEKNARKYCTFTKRRKIDKHLKKNKKDLSCGFAAVINAVHSRDL